MEIKATLKTITPALTSDQCEQPGSLGWALSRKLKGNLFDSWSGHMPGLQGRSGLWLGGVREAIN